MVALASNIFTFQTYFALAIFVLAFSFIISEKLPNAVAAMMGGFLLLAFHIIDQEDAVEYIDFDTIGLLCGMMITVAVLRKSGLFEYIAIKGVKITKGNPWKILVVLSIVTGVLSAFLDNVTTVLIIVPLTFAVADTIKINPTPILFSEILFSNIGGAATLIGDPPNIMIGGATHLQFMDFIIVNGPVILIVSVVTIFILRLIYYKKLTSIQVDTARLMAFDEKRTIPDKTMFIQSMVVFTLIIVAFVTQHVHQVSLASIALGGGFLMIMVTRQHPEEILKEVEWPTLFFFAGLFVIIGGLEKTGVISMVADKMISATNNQMGLATQLVLWVSAMCTVFINSIPYTATMISVIKDIGEITTGNIDPLWWALSLGACLGGNASTIGAAANIIVAGFTQKTAWPIKFGQYFKVGFPLMLVSVIIVSVYLHLVFFFWGS
ncbi:MAG: ArsB/NhaD family transporter [Bacteroidales bacterium]|nr:ArsB/NhaD family transporter [Bacteroidales bacterium]